MADVFPEVFNRLEQLEKRVAELESKGSVNTGTTAPTLSSTATPPFDTASTGSK